MRNNLSRRQFFLVITLICLPVIATGAVGFFGGYNLGSALLLGGGLVVGLPAAVAYYYYRGRSVIAGYIEYDRMQMADDAYKASSPAKKLTAGQTTNVMRKEGDGHATHTQTN